MQILYKNLAISSYLHEDNMPKVLHYNTVYFLFAPVIYEMFVYKHIETIEYVKSSLLFKKNSNFTGK